MAYPRVASSASSSCAICSRDFWFFQSPPPPPPRRCAWPLAATSLAVHVTLGPAGGVAAEGGLTTLLAVVRRASPCPAAFHRSAPLEHEPTRALAPEIPRETTRDLPLVRIPTFAYRTLGVVCTASARYAGVCARRSGVFPVAFLTRFRLGCCSSIAPRVGSHAARRFVHLGFEAKKKNGTSPQGGPRPLSLPGGQDILRELGEIERASLLVLR